MNTSPHPIPPAYPAWLEDLYTLRTSLLAQGWAQGWLQRALPLKLSQGLLLVGIQKRGIRDSQHPHRFLGAKIKVQTSSPTKPISHTLEGLVEIVDEPVCAAPTSFSQMEAGMQVVLRLCWRNRGPADTGTESRTDAMSLKSSSGPTSNQPPTPAPSLATAASHSPSQALYLRMEQNLAQLSTQPNPAYALTLLALKRFAQAWEHRLHLPGACALAACQQTQNNGQQTTTQTLERLVGLAAETRARFKAQRLVQHEPPHTKWEWEHVEQRLYATMLTYLGGATQRTMLTTLAKQLPYRALKPIFTQNENPKHALLARWFGLLGLLENPRPAWHSNPAFAAQWREYQHLRQLFIASGTHPGSHPGSHHATDTPNTQLENHPTLNTPAASQTNQSALRQTRPWNRLERRLVGFWHHLHITAPHGLLKYWLHLLAQLVPLLDTHSLAKATNRALLQAFATPQQEAWSTRFCFGVEEATRGAQLIGQQHITVLMANAVVPVLLGYKRQQEQKHLEKVLYRLCLVLAPETANKHVRAMQKRLLTFHPLKPSLRIYQGLLQINQDFCQHFDQGCHGCTLPPRISPL